MARVLPLPGEWERKCAEAAMLREALVRVIGDHTAPSDCYSTGPLTNNPVMDTACPSCDAIAILTATPSDWLAEHDAEKDAEIARLCKQIAEEDFEALAVERERDGLRTRLAAAEAERDGLAATVELLLRLATEIRGFVKPFGLDDDGVGITEYDRWKKSVEALTEITKAEDHATNLARIRREARAEALREAQGYARTAATIGDFFNWLDQEVNESLSTQS